MKPFFVSLLVRAALGYAILVLHGLTSPETLGFLISLANYFPVLVGLWIFFVIITAEAVITWIKLKVQLKGVGSKSQRHAGNLSK